MALCGCKITCNSTVRYSIVQFSAEQYNTVPARHGFVHLGAAHIASTSPSQHSYHAASGPGGSSVWDWHQPDSLRQVGDTQAEVAHSALASFDAKLLSRPLLLFRLGIALAMLSVLHLDTVLLLAHYKCAANACIYWFLQGSSDLH